MKPYRYIDGRCLDLVQRYYGLNAYDEAQCDVLPLTPFLPAHEAVAALNALGQ